MHYIMLQKQFPYQPAPRNDFSIFVVVLFVSFFMILILIFVFFNGDFSFSFQNNFDEWKINIVIKHMACVCTAQLTTAQRERTTQKKKSAKKLIYFVANGIRDFSFFFIFFIFFVFQVCILNFSTNGKHIFILCVIFFILFFVTLHSFEF